MMRQLLLVHLALGLAACAGEDQFAVSIESRGDAVDFAPYVQPVLEVGCASLDCHGDAGRPLRLYGRRGLRLDPTLRGLDASDEELAANIAAIDGIDPDAEQIEDHLVLLKPLAVSAGGIHHIGGDLWSDQSIAAYRCLHAWLRAGVSDDAGRTVCSEVFP